VTSRAGSSLVAVAFFAALLAGVAHAQDASPDQALAEIREMALYARYREALVATQAFLERADLSATQRNTGLEVLATVHIALRDQPAASQALQQLYARDPQHQLSDPDASPPVLSAFGRARGNPPAPVTVEIVHEAPALATRRPPVLEVRLGANADAVDELRIRYRQGDDDRFTTVVMNARDGVASARLPVLDREEAYTVHYVIEALAPSGAVLASRGSDAEPLALAMPEAARASTSEDAASQPAAGGGDDLWWLWTIIGVAIAAGGAVGAYFIVQEVTGPTNGSLDTIQLPLVRF